MKDSLKLKTEIGAGALHAKSVHAIPPPEIIEGVAFKDGIKQEKHAA